MADGFVILDKERGMFSRTAGGRVARLFGTRKFGHIGTLDPMATGVLPIAIGNATKMIPFIEMFNAPKEYLFGVQFGIETDSLDITGTVTVEKMPVPDADAVRKILPAFTGQIEQIPPAFSAVHIGGARAYELARRGTPVNAPARAVTIYALELVDAHDNNWTFRMRCSRGTYVRAVARDIAHKLGTVATVDMIRRTDTNRCNLDMAVKLDFLEKVVNNNGALDKYLMPMDGLLGDIPVTHLDKKSADLFTHGGFIDVTGNDGLTRVWGDKFIGIGTISDGVLRPKRII